MAPLEQTIHAPIAFGYTYLKFLTGNKITIIP